jgi:hypothetical protein
MCAGMCSVGLVVLLCLSNSSICLSSTLVAAEWLLTNTMLDFVTGCCRSSKGSAYFACWALCLCVWCPGWAGCLVGILCRSVVLLSKQSSQSGCDSAGSFLGDLLRLPKGFESAMCSHVKWSFLWGSVSALGARRATFLTRAPPATL